MTSRSSLALGPALAVLLTLLLIGLLAPAATAAPGAHLADRRGKSGPLVIAHRGASGYRPEHTLAAYRLAIKKCADYIEPDLVSTSDGVLVARHQNEISATTDVADHPEFADRRTTRTIDGVALTGWFTEDFTYAELQTLRAKEGIPAIRPQNTRFDGKYRIPSLDQVIDLARSLRTCKGRRVGIYPETKHPSYFDSIGLSLEEPLVATLDARGYRDQRDPVFVQSFEVGNLRELDAMTDVRLVQLAACSGSPVDDPRPYTRIMSRRGLANVARYAEAAGPCADLVIPRRARGALGRPTRLVRRAHRAGLLVHAFTFRAENAFLPTQFRSSADPNERGDLAGEVRAFVRAGLDGFFSDHPGLVAAALRRR